MRISVMLLLLSAPWQLQYSGYLSLPLTQEFVWRSPVCDESVFALVVLHARGLAAAADQNAAGSMLVHFAG